MRTEPESPASDVASELRGAAEDAELYLKSLTTVARTEGTLLVKLARLSVGLWALEIIGAGLAWALGLGLVTLIAFDWSGSVYLAVAVALLLQLVTTLALRWYRLSVSKRMGFTRTLGLLARGES